MPKRFPARRLPLSALAACLFAGCASGAGDRQSFEPPQRQLGDMVRPHGVADPIAVYDPIEGTNRGIYKFNAQLDRHVLIPVVETYEDVTPRFLRDRVSSFFLNLGEVSNFTNSVFQLSAEKAVPTFFRFTLNSTLGLLGLFDIASDFGIPRQNEDFGQTLGYWGVEPGPYLVLPVLGPSNARDAVGTAVDFLTLSLVVPADIANDTWYQGVRYGLGPIDTRYRVGFRYYATGSPFEYSLVRYVTTQARNAEIGK